MDGLQRPSQKTIQALYDHVSAATAAGELYHMGIRDPFIKGPMSFSPGFKMVGPAITLQFMPKREDVANTAKYADPARQPHRRVMFEAKAGDVVVVDARGDMSTGVLCWSTGRPSGSVR